MKSLTAALLACGCLAWSAASAQAQLAGGFTTFGSGCPGVTGDSGPVLYGTQPAGAWTLGGSSLTFVSDGSSWSLQAGGAFIEPSFAATELATGAGLDDAVIGPVNLPFAFPYPGGAGSTTAIDVNSNGRVYLEAGTNAFSQGWSAAQVLPDLLAATPSVCALGVDLDPSAGGAILFETRVIGGAAVAVVTWDEVPEASSSSPNTFQCQLWETGAVVLSYGSLAGGGSLGTALVGCSAGGGTSDPGASDLAVPLSLSLEGSPILGAGFSVRASGVPLTAAIAFLAIGTDQLPSPVPLSPMGAPAGCSLWVDQVFLYAPMALSPPLAAVGFNLNTSAGLVGLTLECQALIVDPAQVAPLPWLVSNGGTVTIGSSPSLRFVVEGENSFYGSPGLGGFFRLESSQGASHADITGLKLSVAGTPYYFDIEGNSATEGQGYFEDGNGVGPTCQNAYYGSDVVTGLVYGGPFQHVSCDGSGTSGWVGGAAVGGSPTRFRELEFEFDDFSAGETFGFDCDTDGGEFDAAVQPVTVTVTFSDSSQITAAVQFKAPGWAEGVLIP